MIKIVLERWLRRAATVTGQHDVFLSYRHADRVHARAIQAGLHRIGRSWWKIRATSVFRDEDSMAVNDALKSTIERALQHSGHFVLVASPHAAASPWVAKEIAMWRAFKPRRPITLVVASGEIVWLEKQKPPDFDWIASTALPHALQGWFEKEPPLWADLRGLKTEQLTLDDEPFRLEVRKIAAAVRGKTPEQIASDELREHRRTLAVSWSVAIVLAVLLALLLRTYFEARRHQWQAEMAEADAKFAAVREMRQAEIARKNQARAEREQQRAETETIRAEKEKIRAEQEARRALARQLAAQSAASRDDDVALAARLALAAVSVENLLESRGAVFGVLQRHRQLRRVFDAAIGPDEEGDIDLSPDGRYAVTRRLRNYSDTRRPFSAYATVWDLSTRSVVRLPGAPSSASDVAFSADSRTWAVADRQGRIRIWDRNRDVVRTRFQTTLQGGVQTLRYDDSGAFLVAGDGRSAVVLDAVTGEIVMQPRLLYDGVFACPRVELAAGILLVAERGSRPVIRAIDDGQEFQLPMTDDGSRVTATAVAHDGSVAIAGRLNGEIELWSLISGQKLSVQYQNDGEEVTKLVLTRKGLRMISLSTTSMDDGMRSFFSVWNAQGERVGRRIDGPWGYGTRIAADAEGSRIAAVTGGRVLIWDVGAPHVLATRIQSDRPTRWARPAGNDLLLICNELGAVRLVRASTGAVVLEIFPEIHTYTSAAAVTEGGRRIAIVTDSDTKGKSIQVWTDLRRDPTHVLPIAESSEPELVLSSDGRFLAFEADGVEVYDLEQRQVVRQLPIRPRFFGFVRGGHALFAADDHSFSVVDLATGATRRVATPTLAFPVLSNDGRFYAGVEDRRFVKVFDVEAGVQAGRVLVSGAQPLRAVAMNGDGTVIATAGAKGHIILWDRSRYRVLGELSDDGTEIQALWMSRDGTAMFSRNSSSAGLHWSLDAQTIRRAACALAGRDFTLTEWAAYVGKTPFTTPCGDFAFASAADAARRDHNLRRSRGCRLY